MSLGFTDDEIKEISFNYIKYSENKANELQGKAKILQTQGEVWEKDQSNKKWTDFDLSVIGWYVDEEKFLNGNLRAMFPGEANVDDAARKRAIHYPVEYPAVPWVHIPPKMIDSNKGIPVGSYSGVLEPDTISGVLTSKELITTGFSDGSHDTDLTNGYTIGGTTIDCDDITGFAVGHRLLIISGNIGMFAKIDSIAQDAGFCTGGSGGANEADCISGGGVWTTPPSGTLTITVLSPPSSNLPSGANVSNYASGFTNGEREGTTGITIERQAVLDIFKGVVDDSVQNWEDKINEVKSAISLNEDQKRKTEIADEIARIDARIVEIDSWQSFPSEKQFGPTVESRFGDIKLGDLETSYNGRSSEITARIAQIGSALDTLSQDGTDAGKGAFSGSGVYYDYYDWFNKRVNSAQGTLAQYYSVDIALEVIDQTIANLDSDKAETETIMRIEILTADADGTQSILLADTTGFFPSDTVKVVANDQPVITTTILSVGTGSIILATSVPTDYTLGNETRLVKEL
jgi:hypothetical protein